jgi:hypothetical protein
LDRSGDGDLRRPSDPLEQPRYLALAVGGAELFVEDPGDPFTGPDLAAEAIGLGAMPEEVREEKELLGGEPAERPRRGVGAECLRPAVAGGGEPTTDGALGDIESGRDVALLPALLRELPGPHPSPLPPVVRLRV